MGELRGFSLGSFIPLRRASAIGLTLTLSPTLALQLTAQFIDANRANVFAASAVFQATSIPGKDAGRDQALALEQQGRNADAESAWRSVLKVHPSSAEAYAHLGLLEARQNNLKQAIPLYRKALALAPAMPSLRLNLGLALFKDGDLKQALQQFQLVKAPPAGSPAEQQLTILMGMAHYGLGEFAEAAEFLKKAAAVDTQNLELRLALAHSCLWSKQYQCVLDTYHEILTLNAESAEADMLAGEALDEMKDHGAAIEQFRAAVKADPKAPDVHFGLGYILWTQRQYPEAVSEFQAELANNPNHAQALVHLGDAEMELQHPELSLPLLMKAAAIDNKLELAHLDLGILYSDAGRNEDALRELLHAEKLDTGDVAVHWHLARLYKSMGKRDAAKAEYDKAASIHKTTAEDLLKQMGNGSYQTQPAVNWPRQTSK
jgi:tetratricopeptide (TPR) repeat protein